MTGIASIVDQLLGSSRIPASAAPRTGPSASQPDPRPKKPAQPKPPGPHARLVAALDDDWSPVSGLCLRARVGESFAYRELPGMVAAGIAEERRVSWAKGVRREYRRVRG